MDHFTQKVNRQLTLVEGFSNNKSIFLERAEFVFSSCRMEGNLGRAQALSLASLLSKAIR